MDGPRPMSEMDDIAYLRQVQDGLLPKTCPTCRDVQIFAQSAMLGGVGGDFCDFPSGSGTSPRELDGRLEPVGRLGTSRAEAPDAVSPRLNPIARQSLQGTLDKGPQFSRTHVNAGVED